MTRCPRLKQLQHAPLTKSRLVAGQTFGNCLQVGSLHETHRFPVAWMKLIDRPYCRRSPRVAASSALLEAEGGIAAPVKPSFDPAAWYFIDRTGTVSIIIRAGMGQQGGSAITRSLADGF